jgi:hypothetical protein
MPRGLGKRQGKLIEILFDFERTRPADSDGLSTPQLVVKVFGRKFTRADRVTTSRALNGLRRLGIVKQRRRGASMLWRIDPRIAALIRGKFHTGL